VINLLAHAGGPGDGYSANWLHFMTATAGFELRLEELAPRR
jgi:hypothetical protein